MIFEDKVKKLARICWSRGSIDRSVKSGFSEGGHVSDVLKIYLTLSEQEADSTKWEPEDGTNRENFTRCCSEQTRK